MVTKKVNTTPKTPKGGKTQDRASQGVRWYVALLIGLLVGVIATWGILAILNDRDFSFTIDLDKKTVNFSVTSFPQWEIRSDNHLYVYQDGGWILATAWASQNNYTVTWNSVANEVIFTPK